MRLIDAEALKAKWYKINDIDENDRGARFVGYTEIARLIDQAPTVSADAVHGVWIPCDLTFGRSIWACSACDNGFYVPCDAFTQKPIYDYCPYCGARMEGGDDE